MAVMITILVLAAAVLQPSVDDSDRLDGCSRTKAANLGFGQKAAELQLKSLSDPLAEQTDVLHYRLDLEVDPAAEYLTGSNTMTITSQVDGVSAFRFWLHDVHTINSVEVDGVAAAWQRLDSEVVEVSLGSSYDRGQSFDLVVAYEGSPVTAGLMSIVFETQEDSPVVSTLSEPWFSYTWWPVKEDSRDKATGDLLITVPDDLTVASNGVLLGTDFVGSDRRRFHWSTNYPMSPYLFAFSATRYNTFGSFFAHPEGSMPVEYFIYPESDTTTNRQLWLLSVEMLSTFGDLFGLYPFIDEKYAIYQFPWGGGMEHQTATGQGSFKEYLTAHELAHQWWGDMVTCETWSDIWLNEGFATYSEALWYEFRSGSSNPSALRSAMIQRLPGRVREPVYVYDTSSVGRIFSSDYSYRKGAWVLHMLRGVIGDEAFFATLDEYRRRFEYQTATTRDFQSVVEDISGTNLSWFFSQWIYHGGAPAYEYGWRENQRDGQRFLEISIVQVQQESAFSMPLTIETTELGERHRYTVWNDKRDENFLIEVSGPVDFVEIDPDDWILTRSKTEVAFAGGAPRVVAVEPTPGSNVCAGVPLAITVNFDNDVIVDRSDFVLRRPDETEMDLELTYDPGTSTARLVSMDSLGLGRFEFTIDDSIVGAAAGVALDGELSGPSGPALFPSGDGVPGGDAVVEYVVVGTRRPSTRTRPEGIGNLKWRMHN